jgi:hypothetical protein
VVLHDAAHQAQAHALAFELVAGVHALEGLEQALGLGAVESHAVVGHPVPGASGIAVAVHGDEGPLAAGAVLGGVVEQVLPDLRRQRRVGLSRQQHRQPQFGKALRVRHGQQGPGLLHDRTHVQREAAQRLARHLGQAGQCGDHRAHALGRAGDLLGNAQRFLHLAGLQAFAQQPRQSPGSQRRVTSGHAPQPG